MPSSWKKNVAFDSQCSHLVGPLSSSGLALFQSKFNYDAGLGFKIQVALDSFPPRLIDVTCFSLYEDLSQTIA